MGVPLNKEKYWADLKKFFFSCKGMDRKSNIGYIRSFAHNAELQETQKTVKKPSKNRFFRTSKTVLQKVLARIRRKLAQWCKIYLLLNMEKNNQIRPQRRAAGTPKKRK